MRTNELSSKGSRAERMTFALIVVAIIAASVTLHVIFDPQRPNKTATATLMVVGRIDDHTIGCIDEKGRERSLSVENPYSQAYEVGQLITILK